MSAPRVLVVSRDAPEPGRIAEAARVLRTGLVAFPTETVYGLGAPGLDPAGVARIYAAKGRPAHNPLILHVTDVAAARALTPHFPPAAEALAAAFWPGPMTLVVARAPHVPLAVTGGGETVGLRVPRHPVAQALLAAFGEPVAAPSANKYQKLSPTRAEHVVKSLGAAVDLVLDGGECDDGIESTVIDCTGAVPVVLRPGGLALEAIRAVCPNAAARAVSDHAPAQGGRASARGASDTGARSLPDGDIADGAREAAARSPGQDRVHYAPEASLRLVPTEALAAALLAAGGAKVGVLTWSARGAEALATGAPALAGKTLVTCALGAEARAYAALLYASLHDLDDAGCEAIVVEEPPATPAWASVRDRLVRAARATSGP